jgi:hypothetical protein
MSQAPVESNTTTIRKIVGLTPVFTDQSDSKPRVDFLVEQTQILNPVDNSGVAQVGKVWIEGLMNQVVVEQGGVIFSPEQRKKIEIATLFVNGLFKLHHYETLKQADNLSQRVLLPVLVMTVVERKSIKVVQEKYRTNDNVETLRLLIRAWKRYRLANSEKESGIYLKLQNMLHVPQGRWEATRIHRTLCTALYGSSDI